MPAWLAPVLGGLASGAAGALLGGGSSQSPESVVVPFEPIQSTSGIGRVGFEDGQLSMQLDPQLQALQQAAYGQAGAFMQDPAMMQLGQQAIGQAGGALGALGAFDPTQATAEKFAAMEAIMAPQRAREQESMQAQLLRQGRLGATGGALQQAAQQQMFEQQRMQNLLTAEQAAQQQQKHLLGLGTTLGAFGVQQQAAPTQLSAGALGLGMSPTELQLRQAQLLPQFQPQVQGTYTPAPSVGQQIGAGLLAGGAGMVSGGLQGAFMPSKREQNKTGAFVY